MAGGNGRRPKYGGRLAPVIELGEAERQALDGIIRQRTAAQQLVARAKIIMAAADGLSNVEISHALEQSPDMVGLWRQRWVQQTEIPLEERSAAVRLADEQRSGAPPRISAEQYCQIMAVACESPQDSGRPITHWTAGELADEVVRRGIVETISPRQMRRFFKRCGSEATPNTLLAGSCARRAARCQDR